MRRTIIAALVLLAGCHKSFDERYAEAQAKLSSEAASIDSEMAERASEAATAPDAAPSGSATVAPRS
jgi:hypothetical protein